MTHHWIYQGMPLLNVPPNKIGFVYVIECLPTKRKYIGKKLVRGKGNKLMKYQDYWGSSNEMLEDIKQMGKDKFTRTVLHWAETKSILSYLETTEQLKRNVLASGDYYNQIVHIRVLSNPKLTQWINTNGNNLS